VWGFTQRSGAARRKALAERTRTTATDPAADGAGGG
jgi:hypothetical protein